MPRGIHIFDETKPRASTPTLPMAASGDEGPPLRLQYHDIRTDAAGTILPWSHDRTLRLHLELRILRDRADGRPSG